MIYHEDLFLNSDNYTLRETILQLLKEYEVIQVNNLSNEHRHLVYKEMYYPLIFEKKIEGENTQIIISSKENKESKKNKESLCENYELDSSSDDSSSDNSELDSSSDVSSSDNSELDSSSDVSSSDVSSSDDYGLELIDKIKNINEKIVNISEKKMEKLEKIEKDINKLNILMYIIGAYLIISNIINK